MKRRKSREASKEESGDDEEEEDLATDEEEEDEQNTAATTSSSTSAQQQQQNGASASSSNGISRAEAVDLSAATTAASTTVPVFQLSFDLGQHQQQPQQVAESSSCRLGELLAEKEQPIVPISAAAGTFAEVDEDYDT